MGVMEDRRRIIEAQPHLVTASGETLEINVAERKVKSLRVNFTPVQTGSGTPSPSNPRPVVGWSSIPVSIVPGTSDVLAAVPDGAYGTVDLSTGVMTVTKFGFTGNNPDASVFLDSVQTNTVTLTIQLTRSGFPSASGGMMASHFSTTTPSGTAGRVVLSGNYIYSVVQKSDFSGTINDDAVRNWLIDHNPTYVYTLTTPQTLQLSGITPRTGTVTISPFQQGGGTASPTNLRPIIPVADGASADFSSTIHGGTLDLVSGTGLTTWNIRESTWSDSSAFSAFTKSGDNRIFWVYLGGAVYNDEPLHVLSDQYTFAGYGYDYAGVPVYSMCGSPDYTGSLWVKVPASVLPADSLAGAQAFFQQTLPKFYWPRTVAGRTAISTTPQTILAPRGQQTVTSPAGAVEISYWTH